MEKIISECNQWLEKMCETYMPAKRPNVAAVRDHICTTLSLAIKRDDISNAVEKFADDWNMHTGDANVETITLLDVQLAETSAGSSDRADALLLVGTWTGNPNGFQSLASIWVEIDREFGCPRAVHLDGLPSQNTLWGIVEGALRLQEQQGGQVMDRWLNAPNEWRVAHPICPRCGSPNISLSGDLQKRFFCYSCNWISRGKGFCWMQEFTEESCFAKERKHILKVQKAEDELRECAMLLDKNVTRLEQVTIKDALEGASINQLERQIKDIISRLEKVENRLIK